MYDSFLVKGNRLNKSVVMHRKNCRLPSWSHADNILCQLIDDQQKIKNKHIALQFLFYKRSLSSK